MRWDSRRTAKHERLKAAADWLDGKILDSEHMVDTLHVVLRSGNRVALEGDNQKQADFLSRSLAEVDPGTVGALHMLMSSVSRPEHIDIFERGIAGRLDFAYAGPQSVRMAHLLQDGLVEIGAIRTYVRAYVHASRRSKRTSTVSSDASGVDWLHR